MRKVLIVGAAGFIGQHLQTCFAAQGWQVFCSAQRAETFSDSAYFSECDGKDLVINSAGLAHSRLPSHQHTLYERINAEFALQLAQGVIACEVPRFIHLSSVKAAAYEVQQAPNTERHQAWPSDAYGRSKRQGEELLLALDWRATQSTILRPALVFGPGVKANLRALIMATHAGWLPRITGGGERSLLAIDDLCSAVLAAAKHATLPEPIFILADTETYTVERIQAAVRQVQGKSEHTRYRLSSGLLKTLAKFPTPLQARLEKLLETELYSSARFCALTDWQPRHHIEESMPAMMTAFGLPFAAPADGIQ